MIKQILIIAVLVSFIKLSLAIARYYAALRRVEEQKRLLKIKWEELKTIVKH